MRDLDWQLLDDEHAVCFTTEDGHGGPTGLIEAHYRPDNHEPCWGGVSWTTPSKVSGAIWQLVSLEPLHLEPSLLCRANNGHGECGHHGWIRDGKWVPA